MGSRSTGQSGPLGNGPVPLGSKSSAFRGRLIKAIASNGRRLCPIPRGGDTASSVLVTDLQPVRVNWNLTNGSLSWRVSGYVRKPEDADYPT